MSLLTIAQDVSYTVGIKAPTAVFGNTERNALVMLEAINETGEELARRVDWGELTATTTLTGDGTNLSHPMPADFSRIVKGVGVRGSGGTVRPLTRAEWGTLTATEGVPRYFLLEGDTLEFWPYLANAATATVTYQSLDWCTGGAAFTADDETALIDEELIAKGAEVRWRRAQGMEYADQEAEYEAAIQDFAQFDNRSRL